MTDRAVRCTVSGRVQGVFYRASTAEQARRLGLTGYAKNLPSGDVEVIVAGDPVAISKLTAWLWQGPPSAVVESVRVEEWVGPPRSGFTTF